MVLMLVTVLLKKVNYRIWDKCKTFLRLADKWVDYEYVYGSHNVEKGSDSQGFYDTDVWRTIADKYRISENNYGICLNQLLKHYL
jgi:hypothetical protein